MTESNAGGNGRKPVNGGARSSADPAVVTFHRTLDEIEQTLGGEPMCDFAEVDREVAAIAARSIGLRASIAELSKQRAIRRRSRRPAAR